jgi:uncharacterized protein RhaS with RHS repeats
LAGTRLGSIIAQVTHDGTSLEINRYDPYGVPEPTNTGRFQYTGQIFLPEVGLYHYKARVYNPYLGVRSPSIHFARGCSTMQTDPIGYDDGPNWYAYVHNNPVNATDPTGMLCIKKNTFCSRKERYQKLARDPKLSKITVFPAAAATTLDTLDTPRSLTGYSKSSIQWLEGFSADLEVENNKVFSALKAGKTVPGITDSPDGIDRGMVRFEQGLLQNALNSLQASDPDLYDQVVSETNSIFENYGWGSNAIQAAEGKLGRSLNFANQSDREQIGYQTVRIETAFSCARGAACDARSFNSE